MRIHRGALLLLLVLLPPVARAGETTAVEENWPDGTPKLRYSVDAEGRKDGTYNEYWENGSRKLRAHYRHGVLQGSWLSYYRDGEREITATYRQGNLHGRYLKEAPDGSPLLESRYRNGRLDGRRTARRGGAILATQEWEEGRLVEMNGVVPFPRPKDEIAKSLRGILAAPKTADDPVAADREAAFRRLKAYRYLAGVPYEDLVLDEDLCDHALAAARLCERVGRLAHELPNPGLPDAEYRYALEGTRNCNLHGFPGALPSLDGFLDDSDPSNLAQVGHRSWCLNPRMGKTGFGVSGNFCAMWATDESGRGPAPTRPVRHPAPGYYPASFFGPRIAWSVWFDAGAGPGRPTAEIVELDETYLPVAGPLPLDCDRIAPIARGPGTALVFRPKEIDTSPGHRYAVRVRDLPGAKEEDGLFYVVEFTALAGRDG